VNHLTRMEKGYVCVAGIDVETLHHVRPVVDGRLSTACLKRNGGPFDMTCVVDLGPTTHAGHPPETEDYKFDLRKASLLRLASPDEFKKLLKQMVRPRLSEIFGPELVRIGSSSCGVDVGRGSVSLGCLIPARQPSFYLKARPGKADQVRMRVYDGDFDLDLSITDIRLYQSDHVTPNADLVSRIDQRLKSGADVILSVGLTRPFASSTDLSPMHWLQVNNIHLEENLTWLLG